MGKGMSKIIEGVYVGSLADAESVEELDKFGVTHVLCVMDRPGKKHGNRNYLNIQANDVPQQGLSQHFEKATKFIHEARMSDKGCVLIHCMAGVSRSVTLTLAYLITVTELPWRDCLNAVRASRQQANPNHGFQKQLEEWQKWKLAKHKVKFEAKYPGSVPCSKATSELQVLLEKYLSQDTTRQFQFDYEEDGAGGDARIVKSSSQGVTMIIDHHDRSKHDKDGKAGH